MTIAQLHSECKPVILRGGSRCRFSGQASARPAAAQLQVIREARFYTRLALGIVRLMRTPPLADPHGVVRDQIAHREKRLLATLRKTVFDEPRNPFGRMFELAGCSYEDLETMVGRAGLERTLAAVHREGVYLTHDEFKGRTPIVRSGQQIPSDEKSFDNTLVRGLIGTMSSGSRSRGTVTSESIAFRLYRESYYRFVQEEFRLDKRLAVAVEAILPSQNGISSCLKTARVGSRLDHWFSIGGSLRDSFHYRAATNGFVLLGNLLGARGCYPDYLAPNDYSPAARWIHQRIAAGLPCVVETNVSSAVRVCTAALDDDLDISGTIFLVGGETLTAAKRKTIEDSGCLPYPNYWMTELGPVGYACRQMNEGNCVHLFHDAFAAVSHKRLAPLSNREVDSLSFTTLLPSAPRIFINVEMDDSGVVEKADCDCVFSRLGMNYRLCHLSSFGKLTGSGMSLVGSDVLEILEVKLPQELGGAAGDYQLVERETSGGSSIELRVSPRVKLTSVERAREEFLTAIRGCFGGSLAVRDWRHGDAVEVVQEEPLRTSSGKVLPLHLLKGAVAVKSSPPKSRDPVPSHTSPQEAARRTAILRSAAWATSIGGSTRRPYRSKSLR